MSDYQTIFNSEGRAAQVEPLHGGAPPVARNLFPCPDCGRGCSRQAESCPGCGRFFQRFAQDIVVSRSGWVSTIAFGILWAAVLPWLIIAVIVFVLLVMGGVLAGVSK